jgi:hypothetical protein
MVKLVQIPRHLLHVELDDLGQLGVSKHAREALRAVLADLPLVPGAADSAVLLGRPQVTLACLAVLARHVGQGLRDHNLTLAADKARLHVERRKLIFLDAVALDEILASDDQRPRLEAVVFVAGTSPRVLELFAQREAQALASFVTSTSPVAGLARWRHLHLEG